MVTNILAVLFIIALIVTGKLVMKKVPVPTDHDRYVNDFWKLWDRRVKDPKLEGPYIVTDENGQLVVYTGLGIAGDGEFVKVER